jgi:hypothetical protein
MEINFYFTGKTEPYLYLAKCSFNNLQKHTSARAGTETMFGTKNIFSWSKGLKCFCYLFLVSKAAYKDQKSNLYIKDSSNNFITLRNSIIKNSRWTEDLLGINSDRISWVKKFLNFKLLQEDDKTVTYAALNWSYVNFEKIRFIWNDKELLKGEELTSLAKLIIPKFSLQELYSESYQNVTSYSSFLKQLDLHLKQLESGYQGFCDLPSSKKIESLLQHLLKDCKINDINILGRISQITWNLAWLTGNHLYHFNFVDKFNYVLNWRENSDLAQAKAYALLFTGKHEPALKFIETVDFDDLQTRETQLYCRVWSNNYENALNSRFLSDDISSLNADVVWALSVAMFNKSRKYSLNAIELLKTYLKSAPDCLTNSVLAASFLMILKFKKDALALIDNCLESSAFLFKTKIGNERLLIWKCVLLALKGDYKDFCLEYQELKYSNNGYSHYRLAQCFSLFTFGKSKRYHLKRAYSLGFRHFKLAEVERFTWKLE